MCRCLCLSVNGNKNFKVFPEDLRVKEVSEMRF